MATSEHRKKDDTNDGETEEVTIEEGEIEQRNEELEQEEKTSRKTRQRSSKSINKLGSDSFAQSIKALPPSVSSKRRYYKKK